MWAPATISTDTKPLSHEASLEPSSYLTDGLQLFRVVRRFTLPPGESFALLEDCRTLEAHALTPDELWAMHLRVVRGPFNHRAEPKLRASRGSAGSPV